MSNKNNNEYPILFIKSKQSEIETGLLRERLKISWNIFFEICNNIVESLPLTTRSDRKKIKEVINFNINNLDFFEKQFIEVWLVKAFNMDLTFLYAENYLIQKINRNNEATIFQIKENFNEADIEIIKRLASMKNKSTFQSSKLTFIDYLKIDGAEKFASALKKEFAGSKGKTIALMIYSIKDYLIDDHIVKKDLYEKLATYFETSIGSDASINRFLNKGIDIVDIKYMKEDVEKVENRVDKILKTL